jgi:hypothetical protein
MNAKTASFISISHIVETTSRIPVREWLPNRIESVAIATSLSHPEVSLLISCISANHCSSRPL